MVWVGTPPGQGYLPLSQVAPGTFPGLGEPQDFWIIVIMQEYFVKREGLGRHSKGIY